MEQNKLNLVAEGFLKVFPIVIKYFILLGDELSDPNYSYQDYQILHVLKDMDKVPISTVGDMLLISKSRMTAIVDKLIACELIERIPDKTDRRVINIALTEKGKEFTHIHSENLKSSVIERFSNLSNEELGQFLTSINNFQEIMIKTNMIEKK